MLHIVFRNTRFNQDYKHSDDPPIVFDRLVVYYALKLSITVQCLPDN